ncbi:MAG TPA: hypothetical protein VFP26_13875 [Gemmatimonadaceae bacterium]|nr:hypothetical protein [Gemmatimonadaceae bacterium]
MGELVADQIAAKIGDRALGDIVTVPAPAATKLASMTSTDPARDIARETGARLVISGAYTAQADTMLLRVEIADAERRRLLAVVGPMSVPAAKAAEGLAVMSAQVTSSMARALEPRLAGIMEQRGWSRPIPFDAFKASSQGFELFLSGRSREDYEKAVDLFARAYSLDSTEFNALFEMAIIEQSLEEWARADSLLARTNALRPHMSVDQTYFLDFLIARNRGDHRAAYDFARRAADRWPGAVWEYDAGYHALSSAQPALAARTMSALSLSDFPANNARRRSRLALATRK